MPVSVPPDPPGPEAGTAFVSGGRNPLLSEAGPLLALVPQLRSSAQISGLPQLRARIGDLMQQFDERLRRRGVGPAQAQKARFVLCAMIDEVVETMPWGAGGHWDRLNSPNSPKPAAGAQAGDTVLRQFAQLATDAGTHRDLREFVYVALALGFDARRGSASGAGEADQIRAQLAALLKREPDGRARPLAVRWQPAVGRGSAVGSWLPLWVGTSVAGGLLAVLYCALALALASRSDRVFAQIAALRLASPATAVAAPPPAPQPRLASLLSPAASSGLQVRDEIDRSVVTLRDDMLFEAATDRLLRAGTQSLRSVAAALQHTAGQVVVIGHTDRNSERSARFPSNWELSVERARAVHDALRSFGVAASRLRYDGRADTEPLASAGPHAAPVHSGRVEIVLLAGR